MVWTNERPEQILLPLNPLAACPKCTSTQVAPKYVAEDANPRYPLEHISKLCRVCGYRWSEEPATPEQIAEAQRKRMEKELAKIMNRRSRMPRKLRRWLNSAPKPAA